MTDQYVRRHSMGTARARKARSDDSLTGVLIFSAIGLGLSVLAALFHWLDLPAPQF